ncbi:MAG: copper transporter [Beutenbergiaceae bacterium]
MIDFRYHIVSLIAVFLALAVGIVLGAGPLQQPIGEQLSEQVEQLRQEKEDLRIDLEASQGLVERQRTFIDASSGRLLSEALTDVSVAMVTLAGANSTLTESLVTMIDRAGGAVVANVALTAAWVDADSQETRDDLAQEVGPQLSPPAPLDATTNMVLGRALDQVLTTPPADNGSVPPVLPQVYADLLAAGLITEVVAPAMPADVVLVVAPAPGDSADDLENELQTVIGMGGGVVLAGDDSDGAATDLVSMVRANATAASLVTTVDSTEEIAGQVLVPLAVQVVAFERQVGHYGLASDATAIVPPVVQRPEEPEDATGDSAEVPTTDPATDDAVDSPTEEPS